MRTPHSTAARAWMEVSRATTGGSPHGKEQAPEHAAPLPQPGITAGPGGPGAAVLLDRLLGYADELVDLEDPLTGEIWASNFVSTWETTELIDDDPNRVFGLGLVRPAIYR